METRVSCLWEKTRTSCYWTSRLWGKTRENANFINSTFWYGDAGLTSLVLLRRNAGLSPAFCICWTDGFFSFFHLLSTCVMSLLTFNFLVTLHKLSGTPSNLELRNLERRAWRDWPHCRWPRGSRGRRWRRPRGRHSQKWRYLCRPFLRKPLKRLESGSLRRPCDIVVPLWGSWSQKRETPRTLPSRIPR